MNRAVLTEQFLRALSSHLSSRADCRKVTYRCIIGVDDGRSRQLDILDIAGKDFNKYIMFDPSIYVYPNVHLKHDVNKTSVLEHVLKYHFPEILDSYDILGNVTIHSGLLVPGIYEYQLSVSEKRRRWTRVR